MNLRLAEKQEIYKRKSYPLLYLVKDPDGGREKENVVYSNSGLFYIFVVVIIFACLGVLLNIGLKIQSINYQKNIYEINEMISLEKERSDRLLLKISELKSPSRVIEVAKNDLAINMTDNLKVVEISNTFQMGKSSPEMEIKLDLHTERMENAPKYYDCSSRSKETKIINQ